MVLGVPKLDPSQGEGVLTGDLLDIASQATSVNAVCSKGVCLLHRTLEMIARLLLSRLRMLCGLCSTPMWAVAGLTRQLAAAFLHRLSQSVTYAPCLIHRLIEDSFGALRLLPH